MGTKHVIFKQKMIIENFKYFHFKHIEPLEQDEQKCFLLSALTESPLVNR